MRTPKAPASNAWVAHLVNARPGHRPELCSNQCEAILLRSSIRLLPVQEHTAKCVGLRDCAWVGSGAQPVAPPLPPVVQRRHGHKSACKQQQHHSHHPSSCCASVSTCARTAMWEMNQARGSHLARTAGAIVMPAHTDTANAPASHDSAVAGTPTGEPRIRARSIITDQVAPTVSAAPTALVA